MSFKSIARQIFIASTFALVGAAFTEMSLGSVIRASDGLGIAGFLPAVPFGITFVAGVYLLQALRENRRNALIFSLIALAATLTGRFLFYTPTSIGTNIVDLMVTFSVVSSAILMTAFLIGEYPVPQNEPTE